jgi:hypothetical protein
LRGANRMIAERVFHFELEHGTLNYCFDVSHDD